MDNNEEWKRENIRADFTNPDYWCVLADEDNKVLKSFTRTEGRKATDEELNSLREGGYL